jgi:hypothetical protein
MSIDLTQVGLPLSQTGKSDDDAAAAAEKGKKKKATPRKKKVVEVKTETWNAPLPAASADGNASASVFLNCAEHLNKEDMVLVQLNDAEMSIKEDSGAIGRFKRRPDEKGVVLDVKGNSYEGQIYKTKTFLVTEERPGLGWNVTSVVDHVIQLKETGSIFRSETAISGIFQESAVDLDFDVNEEFKQAQSDKRKAVTAAKKRKKTAAQTKKSPANKRAKKKTTK